MPIVGIAAHVSRNGSAPDTGSDGIRTGYIMRPAPLPTSTGLPVHIFANFKLHPEGKLLNAGEAKRWNRTLLHELTGNIYVSLLKTLVPLFSKKDNPRELYKVAQRCFEALPNAKQRPRRRTELVDEDDHLGLDTSTGSRQRRVEKIPPLAERV